jgi:ABC-2 type transport system permease protein
MKIILTLLRKDFANFSRDRVAFSLTFVVPIALIYIFGHVFGLNRKPESPGGIRVAVVNQSDVPAAQKLVAALQAEKAFRVITKVVPPGQTERLLTEADLRPMMKKDSFRFAVIIPADIIREDQMGIRLKVLSNPRNEIETQTVNGLLQKTIYSNTPELLGQSLQTQARRVLGASELQRFNRSMATTITNAFGGDKDEIERTMEAGDFGLSQLARAGADSGVTGAKSADSTNGNALGDIVRIETEQVVGAQVKSPAATRVVGGWAIMFLLFALSGTAAAFFDEKKTGIFQRLLAAPVSRAQLLGSRFLWGVLLGLVQLTTLFFAGRVMYGIDVFGNFGNLVVISIAAAAACTAFGLLLAAISPTPAAASGLATFLVLVMSACGGAWFPVSIMPDFMQEIARFTIVYWAMEGFTQVLWAGNSLTQILPTVGILLGIAAGVMGIAIWRFSRGRLFE